MMLFTKYYAYDLVDSDWKVVGGNVIQVSWFLNPVQVVNAIRVENPYRSLGVVNLRRIY